MWRNITILVLFNNDFETLSALFYYFTFYSNIRHNIVYGISYTLQYKALRIYILEVEYCILFFSLSLLKYDYILNISIPYNILFVRCKISQYCTIRGLLSTLKLYLSCKSQQ